MCLFIVAADLGALAITELFMVDSWECFIEMTYEQVHAQWVGRERRKHITNKMQSYCLLLLLIQVTGSWRIIHDRNHTSTLLLFNDRGWHFMQISKEDWPEKTVPSFFYKTIIGHTYGPPSHAANLATLMDVNVKFKLLLSQQQSIASLKSNRSA